MPCPHGHGHVTQPTVYGVVRANVTISVNYHLFYVIIVYPVEFWLMVEKMKTYG